MRSSFPTGLTRRSATAALLAPLLVTRPGALLAFATESTETAALPPSKPSITGKATLAIAVGTADAKQLTIGLYGKSSPASTKLFADLCRGTVDSGSLGAPPLSYRGSVATRVEPGKAIVLGRLAAGSAQILERSIDQTGYVRTELVNLADRYKNTDANSLSHDRAGLVSMRKGGGAFEFVLTPGPNPSLDESNIIIGEVLAGMDVVEDMATVPVRKPANEDEVGAVIWALGAYDESRYLAVAKAGGDPRARIEQAYKPLKKIKIVDCAVL